MIYLSYNFLVVLKRKDFINGVNAVLERPGEFRYKNNTKIETTHTYSKL